MRKAKLSSQNGHSLRESSGCVAVGPKGAQLWLQSSQLPSFLEVSKRNRVSYWHPHPFPVWREKSPKDRDGVEDVGMLRLCWVAVVRIWVRSGGTQVVLGVKNPPANGGDARDVGSIPGWGRSPGVGNGSPLQYSFLENPLDRGGWWATVHRVAELDVTEQLKTHTQIHIHACASRGHSVGPWCLGWRWRGMGQRGWASGHLGQDFSGFECYLFHHGWSVKAEKQCWGDCKLGISQMEFQIWLYHLLAVTLVEDFFPFEAYSAHLWNEDDGTAIYQLLFFFSIKFVVVVVGISHIIQNIPF